MDTRDLLLQLRQSKPGEPMKVPAFINPDRFSEHGKYEELTFWAEFDHLVKEKRPPYIEVGGWAYLDSMHIQAYYEPLIDALGQLFLLKVNHIHFNFSDLDGASNVVNKVFHCVNQAYAANAQRIKQASQNKSKQLVGLDLGAILTSEFPPCFPEEKDFSVISETITKPPKRYTYLALANLYESRGDYDSADIAYQRVLQLEPARAMSYYERGLFYLRQNQLDNALKDFQQTVQLEKQAIISNTNLISKAYFYSARILLDSGNVQDAKEAIQLLSQIDTNASFYAESRKLFRDTLGKLVQHACDSLPGNKPPSIELYEQVLDQFNFAIAASGGAYRNANLARGKLLLACNHLPAYYEAAGFKTRKEMLLEANRDFESYLEQCQTSSTAKRGIARCEDLLNALSTTVSRQGIFSHTEIEVTNHGYAIRKVKLII